MIKQNRRAAMVFIFAIAAAVHASPSVAADISNGETLSRRRCVAWHLVAGNQVQASADVDMAQCRRVKNLFL